MEEDKTTPLATPAKAKSGNDVTVSDLDRLRKLKEAVNEQMKYTQERTKMTAAPMRTTSGGLVTRRFSPIKEEGSGSALSPSLEEAFPSSSPLPTGAQTTSTESTESAKTIRGSALQTPSQPPLRTPSYPFPYIPGTPRTWSTGFQGFHKPFTTLSPTVFSNVHDTPGDRTSSEVSTPAASVLTFMPSGASPAREGDEEQFPTPNLYELTAELNLEPGLHSWWQTVARIMNRNFAAVRASLAVPADEGELENVPWGQTATYNEYGPPGVNAVAPESGKRRKGRSESNVQAGTSASLRNVSGKERKVSPAKAASTRPAMLSRHSYAGYERDRGELITPTPTPAAAHPERPKGPLRTKTHAPQLVSRVDPFLIPTSTVLNHGSGTPGQTSTVSDLEFSSMGSEAHVGPFTVVMPALQGLDHEDHALINSTYVNRIISRGKVVALTREYGSTTPTRGDISVVPPSPASTTGSKTGNPQLPTKILLHSEIARNKLKLPHEYFVREPQLISFEEFEQFPSSPWAQSPAPSPAIQADPEENPFSTLR